jgi:uncharacterized lipoprotein YddW (UPF0748 family)
VKRVRRAIIVRIQFLLDSERVRIYICSIVDGSLRQYAIILRRLTLLLVFVLAASSSLVLAQASGVRIPKREVRAVWIATVGGLDWPKSHDPTEQRRSLLEMIVKLKASHFNTIFFQIRGRGDVMYDSPFEPWSDQLTGTLGRNPGWDPLGFMLEEAHKRGMEIHAWFNTFLLKTGRSKPPESSPRHLLLHHPEWSHLVEGDWWLDPGIPAVREYLVDVGMDIVRRYDIDGFQFDFVRYPGRAFPDDAAYKRYGHGASREDWRRTNINRFIEAFYDSAIAVKPMLKVGSTPIGIYTNVTKSGGWQGYYDLFQDSRGWLRHKSLDYLAPQIYWSLGDKPGNPDFAALTRDWVRDSYGREITIGVGAYKPEVHRELPELIDSSRSAGAGGDAFFRYEHIADILGLGGRYRYPADIPPMMWKDSLPPNAPRNFAVHTITDGIVRLQWDAPLRAEDGDTARYYNVYRSMRRPIDIENAENLLTITSTSSTMCTDTISHAMAAQYYYAVSAFDKGNNESLPTREAAIIIPEIASLSKQYAVAFKLGEQMKSSASNLVFLQYQIGQASPVLLKILDASNREVLNVVDAVQQPGRYVAAAEISKLKRGTYSFLLVAGEYSARKELDIN